MPFGLVVDDDAVILIHAAHILEDAGFRTLAATNAAEAIDLLQTHTEAVTLLFTDAKMSGGMDESALARETAWLRPDLCISVASGKGEPGELQVPSGATFIREPFAAELVYDLRHQLLPDGKKPEALKRAF